MAELLDLKVWEEKMKQVRSQYIEIPVDSDLILAVIKKQNLEGIHHLKVEMVGNSIEISGTAKKLLMSIKFKVILQPLMANGRKVSFEIINMKPLNQDWIKKVIFNRAPTLTYHNEKLTIDFNQIERIRKIPLVKVKNVEVKDQRLMVGLGV